MAERFFDEAKSRSHMPFTDGKLLFFCQSEETATTQFDYGGIALRSIRPTSRLFQHFQRMPRNVALDYRVWKIYFSPLEKFQPQRLSTGLPSGAVECSPAFFQDQDGMWHVSFVGGVPGRERMRYQLYRMSGPSLAELSRPALVHDWPTRAGFVSPKHIGFALGSELHLKSRQAGDAQKLSVPFVNILRLSFCAEQPEQIIISGVDHNAQIQTLIYQAGTGETFELDGASEVYKPTIFGNRILFAKRLKGGFEDRELWQDTYKLRPSPLKVHSAAAWAN